jgi:type III restriction enzyme
VNLKNYQQNTLAVLRRFFEDCRIYGAEQAYQKITSEPDIASRLGQLRGSYISWDSIPHTPRVCLKVPTGGGKTILAAHAVKIISDTWLAKDYPVVLWVVPSDTIRKQTAEALKNPQHPYREVLAEQFGGKVRVFDIEEKFNIRPADIQGNACIIVSTIQAFRQSSTDKYNVYKHNENLEPHFSRITPTEKMELDGKDKLKFSFVNLLHFQRPLMIVDEAHNAISNLTQEIHGRLNPAAIVELTATPQLNNNTLYNVRATELKEAEMIKLPIELREHLGWETAVDEAIAKRAELEKAAAHETEYLRPILLFQAQDKNGSVNADALKTYLLNTANIPAKEIAVVTGEQKELDGINVFAKTCPIKYIITVEALKEGWDCSFAYVLCSLANVQSNTAVEQLLGRVMRMPYAKSRKVTALNKAYAYVLSPTFGQSADVLVQKLQNKGFGEEEARAVIQQETALPLFENIEQDKVTLTKKLTRSDVPKSIKLNDRTITFTPATTEIDIEKICQKVDERNAFVIKNKFAGYQKTQIAPSPAKQGQKFSVPKLLFKMQGEFVFADPETIFENFDWNIAKLSKPILEPHEFDITPQGNGFIINLDGNRLSYTAVGADQLVMPFVDVSNWTAANLIAWLDRTLKQDDIPQSQMVEWLRQIIEYLTDKRGLKISELMIAKYPLASKIRTKIALARGAAKEQAFQDALFARQERVKLDFTNAFKFSEEMYDGELFQPQSRYKFEKHFLGAHKVPAIDGGESGEEFKCAVVLDSLPQIKYWLRNAARHPNSFCLPTSTDKFYPDFVALLNDGRILVVEYKGAHIIDSKDTKEKSNIGALWEKHTNGKGLFMLAEKSRDGLNLTEQIKAKIGIL